VLRCGDPSNDHVCVYDHENNKARDCVTGIHRAMRNRKKKVPQNVFFALISILVATSLSGLEKKTFQSRYTLNDREVTKSPGIKQKGGEWHQVCYFA
jgi:hypothetical protein